MQPESIALGFGVALAVGVLGACDEDDVLAGDVLAGDVFAGAALAFAVRLSAPSSSVMWLSEDTFCSVAPGT